MAGARFSVRVHPGAPRNHLTGVRKGLVDAGVTAPEAGAQANEQLVGLLSRRLRVGADRIAIVSGAESRIKQVQIDALAQREADARLRGLSARGRRRRRRTGAVATVLAGLVVVGIVIAGASDGSVTRRVASRTREAGGAAHRGRGSSPVPTASTAGRRRRHTQRTAPAPRHPSTLRRPRPDPGRLPQTTRLPTARTHEFAVRMAGLWAAIAGAPIASARAAFFPEAAYVQLKSVGDPRGDFTYRLFYDYRLDVAAAHALLGPGAGASRLIRTTAVGGYAHWVPPGVCDNRVGYYELPNARLVYSEHGQVRSIGIASLISWRGLWYVIHLGAILRGSAGGVVDAPSPGPGVSAYSGTC